MAKTSSEQATPAFTVRNALAGAIAGLETSGVPSPGLAAELLLLRVLNRDRAWLYAHPEQSLSPQQQTEFTQMVERRSAGMPTQYLTGRQEFWGLEFEVSPSVLIPRPETEHVIEVALARMAARRTEHLQIADVGTGSGCIAVALATEFPNAQIMATDISAAALEQARRNSIRHNVATRVNFQQMNLLEKFLAASAIKFDLIASNPPYIGLNEAAELPREVRQHEPHEALFAGADGFALYPPLVTQAKALLHPGGFLIVELGQGAADRARSLVQNSDWCSVAVERDLAGIERVLSAQRAF